MNTILTPGQTFEKLVDGDGKLSLKERQTLQNFAKDITVAPYMLKTLENTGIKQKIEQGDPKNAEQTALVQLYLRLAGHDIVVDGIRGDKTKGAIQKYTGKPLEPLDKKQTTKEKKAEIVKLSEQERIDFSRKILSQWYPKHIVDGILGNLMIESRLNPRAVGDGGKAHGIAQRHRARENPLIAKGFATRTLEGGLRAIHYELENIEKKANKMIMGSQTAEDVARNFDKYYERSNGKSRSDRVAYAKQFNAISDNNVYLANTKVPSDTKKI